MSEPFDRDRLRALAAARIDEPRRDSPEDARIRVPELVRNMRELEASAVLNHEQGTLSQDFALGIWTAMAGLRHDFGIEDERYVDTCDRGDGLRTDGGTAERVSDHVPQTGRRATVRVHYTVETVVEDVVMPIDCDEGAAADLRLFAEGAWDDAPGERDVVHAEVLDEEPVYQDEVDWEEVPDVR